MKITVFLTLLAACLFAGCPGDTAADNLDNGNVETPGAGSVVISFEVKTQANGTPLPVIFRIDCSRLRNSAGLDCKRFLETTARKSFPALRAITGIKLEQACPTMTYVIYNESDWPYGGAGGIALGNCQIAYQVSALDAGYFDPAFGPYDVHELLHQHQYLVENLLNDAHPFFGSTLVEAIRLVGDQSTYQRYLSGLQTAANDSTPTTVCRQMQYKIESSLYLSDRNVVYGFYVNLRPDIQDTSVLVSYMLYAASGMNETVKRALRDGGCDVNFH